MASQNHSGSSIDRCTRSANVAMPCSVMNRATLLPLRSSASGRHTTEEVLTGRAIYDEGALVCTRADEWSPDRGAAATTARNEGAIVIVRTSGAPDRGAAATTARNEGAIVIVRTSGAPIAAQPPRRRATREQ